MLWLFLCRSSGHHGVGLAGTTQPTAHWWQGECVCTCVCVCVCTLFFCDPPPPPHNPGERTERVTVDRGGETRKDRKEKQLRKEKRKGGVEKTEERKWRKGKDYQLSAGKETGKGVKFVVIRKAKLAANWRTRVFRECVLSIFINTVATQTHTRGKCCGWTFSVQVASVFFLFLSGGDAAW